MRRVMPGIALLLTLLGCGGGAPVSEDPAEPTLSLVHVEFDTPFVVHGTSDEGFGVVGMTILDSGGPAVDPPVAYYVVAPLTGGDIGSPTQLFMFDPSGLLLQLSTGANGLLQDMLIVDEAGEDLLVEFGPEQDPAISARIIGTDGASAVLMYPAVSEEAQSSAAWPYLGEASLASGGRDAARPGAVRKWGDLAERVGSFVRAFRDALRPWEAAELPIGMKNSLARSVAATRTTLAGAATTLAGMLIDLPPGVQHTLNAATLGVAAKALWATCVAAAAPPISAAAILPCAAAAVVAGGAAGSGVRAVEEMIGGHLERVKGYYDRWQAAKERKLDAPPFLFTVLGAQLEAGGVIDRMPSETAETRNLIPPGDVRPLHFSVTADDGTGDAWYRVTHGRPGEATIEMAGDLTSGRASSRQAQMWLSVGVCSRFPDLPHQVTWSGSHVGTLLLDLARTGGNSSATYHWLHLHVAELRSLDGESAASLSHSQPEVSVEMGVSRFPVTHRGTAYSGESLPIHGEMTLGMGGQAVCSASLLKSNVHAAVRLQAPPGTPPHLCVCAPATVPSGTPLLVTIIACDNDPLSDDENRKHHKGITWLEQEVLYPSGQYAGAGLGALPVGDYRIRVRATDNEGVTVEQELPIQVVPAGSASSSVHPACPRDCERGCTR